MVGVVKHLSHTQLLAYTRRMPPHTHYHRPSHCTSNGTFSRKLLDEGCRAQRSGFNGIEGIDRDVSEAPEPFWKGLNYDAPLVLTGV